VLRRVLDPVLPVLVQARLPVLPPAVSQCWSQFPPSAAPSAAPSSSLSVVPALACSSLAADLVLDSHDPLLARVLTECWTQCGPSASSQLPQSLIRLRPEPTEAVPSSGPGISCWPSASSSAPVD
jgi:hypothetical protein